ncbi:MAG: esterase, partial [Burkholderiales bacterium PBB5]
PLAAPALLVCSSRRADACPAAQAFAAAAGPTVQVLPQDRRHGAINADLGEPGAYTDAVEAFMRQLDLLPAQK